MGRLPPASGQLAVIVAAVAAVALLAFVVLPVERKPASKPARKPAPFTALLATVDEGSPVAVSRASLLAVASHIKARVYWAGPRPGYVLRLRTNWYGAVFLRYQAAGTPLSTTDEAWLTVTTYPDRPGAYAEMVSLATRKGYGHRRLADGALLIWPPDDREAFLAWPHSRGLVDVYDPTRGVALREILAGNVRAVS